MTIQEITALRKSGRLAEALEAAENEFSINVNKYTVSALFWCLNDLYKTQPQEEVSATIERMKSLYNDYCPNDEIMRTALVVAERTIMPHYQEVKDAVNMAKSGGDAIALYQQFASIYNKDELDKALYPDFGWLIYYALKSTPLNDAYHRKTLLSNYLKLELPRPSILHSLILAEAVKIEQNTPLQFRIRDFMRLWGLENLREEDWQQYKTNEGNVLPSLVEKLIGVYAKELKTDKVEASEEFSDFVDKALEAYPASQNMPYFKAIVLISQGKKEEAIRYYRDLILRFPSKYYLWQQTAALIDDVETQLGLLSKALTLGYDEQFLGSVRLSMAKLLIASGLLDNARYELDRYRDLYQSRHWNLKGEYWTLLNQLNSIVAATDNRLIYSRYSQMADEFIYCGLPEEVAVKVAEKQIEDVKRPGRKIPLWILRTKDGVIRLKKPVKFGLDRKLRVGSIFSVKVHNERVVWIKTLDVIPAADWLKEIRGAVKSRTDRKGGRYAIIDGVFIGSRLLEGISDGASIRCLAIKQENGRWSAVSIIK